MNTFKLNSVACLLFTAAVIFSACGKKGSAPSPNKSSSSVDSAQLAHWPANADVYFVGTSEYSTSSQNSFLPTVWKNGVPTTLANPLADNSSFSKPIPNAIAVHNGDVYVTGSAGIGTEVVAVYWKNGVEQKLANNDVYSTADAIAISGDDVYIAGIVGGKPTLWKNGVATTISTSSGEIFSIYIDGNDVYLAGTSYEQSNISARTAVLWKNGQPVKLDLSAAGLGSEARKVYVKGNDVYVAGIVRNTTTYLAAAVWKNGVPTILFEGGSTTGCDATDVAVNGNDIYVAGYVGNKVTLWKNGVAETMPYQTTTSVQRNILLGFNGSDIYLTAGYDNANPFNQIFWQNGTAYQLSKNLSLINGLAIVPH